MAERLFLDDRFFSVDIDTDDFVPHFCKTGAGYKPCMPGANDGDIHEFYPV